MQRDVAAVATALEYPRGATARDPFRLILCTGCPDATMYVASATLVTSLLLFPCMAVGQS
jgi:hypothetical protein